MLADLTSCSNLLKLRKICDPHFSPTVSRGFTPLGYYVPRNS